MAGWCAVSRTSLHFYLSTSSIGQNGCNWIDRNWEVWYSLKRLKLLSPMSGDNENEKLKDIGCRKMRWRLMWRGFVVDWRLDGEVCRVGLFQQGCRPDQVHGLRGCQVRSTHKPNQSSVLCRIHKFSERFFAKRSVFVSGCRSDPSSSKKWRGIGMLLTELPEECGFRCEARELSGKAIAGWKLQRDNGTRRIPILSKIDGGDLWSLHAIASFFARFVVLFGWSHAPY